MPLWAPRCSEGLKSYRSTAQRRDQNCWWHGGGKTVGGKRPKQWFALSICRDEWAVAIVLTCLYLPTLQQITSCFWKLLGLQKIKPMMLFRSRIFASTTRAPAYHLYIMYRLKMDFHYVARMGHALNTCLESLWQLCLCWLASNQHLSSTSDRMA